MIQYITLLSVFFLGLMSPGPDFIMVSNLSLKYGRKAGILASIGLALGILVHLFYILVGIGLIISQSIVAFNIIKTLGAGYLIYLGLKALLSKEPKTVSVENEKSLKLNISSLASLRIGFLTNVLNPKASIFVLSLFTQLVSPSTDLATRIFYGLSMSTLTFLWFSFVTIILSQQLIQKVYLKFKTQIEKVFGVVLTAFGLEMVFSKGK